MSVDFLNLQKPNIISVIKESTSARLINKLKEK
jgi:hypothetical protein